MANEQNLIPNSERTPSERRENARKAGIASGEARRARKTLKEELLLLLELDDNNKKITIALLEKALNGDIAAYTTIRDTIGERPAVEKNVSISSSPKLADVLNQLGGGLGDDD